jgi:hypothetical protein
MVGLDPRDRIVTKGPQSLSMMAIMANVAGSANGYMLTNDANIRTAVKAETTAGNMPPKPKGVRSTPLGTDQCKCNSKKPVNLRNEERRDAQIKKGGHEQAVKKHMQFYELWTI